MRTETTRWEWQMEGAVATEPPPQDLDVILTRLFNGEMKPPICLCPSFQVSEKVTYCRVQFLIDVPLS